MNPELIQKNLDYQKDVEQIAKMLFHAFYYDEEEILENIDETATCGDLYDRLEAQGLPGAEVYEKAMTAILMEKAEKIFGFFSSVEDAKKTIQFLQNVNPAKAKEIIDEM